ncbi:MAG TPA: hypothetical protein VKT77_11200 [Chthonomonadaceae bacterium]|nr:hypothetical protein [Chthonomonadaceae bacterium]
MAQLISARLPERTADRVKQYAQRRHRSVNETVSVALEEWLRQNEFAFIEFRDTPDGRMAYMKNSRLPVYWVIKIAKSYGMDIDRVCSYWPNRLRAWVQAAFNYYEAFSDEIDEQIALYDAVTFDTLKRQLPQIEAITIPASALREE